MNVQNGNRRPVGEDDIEQLIDGRLPPERLEAVRQFLAEHPAEQARVAADEALRTELRRQLDPIAAEAIPSRLRVSTLLARRRQDRRQRFGTVAAGVALLALGLGTGWQARGWREEQWRAGPQQPAPSLAEAGDAIAAHRVFVVETVHPVEVGAAQGAHLVQWLSRRVGHPLRAPDLSGQGYRLMGGRVLPAEREAAAQFMYERGEGGPGNRLTLYVRADARADTAFHFADADGFAAFSWIDAGLGSRWWRRWTGRPCSRSRKPPTGSSQPLPTPQVPVPPGNRPESTERRGCHRHTNRSPRPIKPSIKQRWLEDAGISMLQRNEREWTI